MNKPLTLLMHETKNNLIQTINNSTLPPCILELIVKDILNEIHVLSQKQLQDDELLYMNLLSQTESTDEEQTEQ